MVGLGVSKIQEKVSKNKRGSGPGFFAHLAFIFAHGGVKRFYPIVSVGSAYLLILLILPLGKRDNGSV
jgi:hypothetical protein